MYRVPDKKMMKSVEEINPLGISSTQQIHFPNK